MPQRTGSLNKAARLIILQQMMDAGTLDENKTRLAESLGVTRNTIYLDLHDLEQLQPFIDATLKRAREYQKAHR